MSGSLLSWLVNLWHGFQSVYSLIHRQDACATYPHRRTARKIRGTPAPGVRFVVEQIIRPTGLLDPKNHA
jgi:hypothetical protein